jgi:large subunit ribosomal protein L10e
MSFCTTLQNEGPSSSSLIVISNKWDFTKFNAAEFEEMVAAEWLIPDSFWVKYIPNHGPLDKWQALNS